MKKTVENTERGFRMICEANGNLRTRARATTALATIALMAVMSGISEDAAAAASSNTAGKGGKLVATDATPNSSRKGGKLAATSNASRKGGKLPATGARTNASGKGGKLTASGGAGNVFEAKGGGLIRILPAAAIDPAADLPDDIFRSDPEYDKKYNAEGQVDIYGGKTAVEPPRPIEVGRKQYTAGQYGESNTFLGEKNPILAGLAIYGDWRTAVAYNNNEGNKIAQVATRINIDVDFKFTGTERLHAFFTPLQDDAQFTRYEFGGADGDKEFNAEFDFNPQTLFFEGDIGSIYAGISGEYASFDLPITLGLFPLFLQNGIWANDAILGGALSLTARNSKTLGLSNYDVTFFAAGTDVNNPGVLDAAGLVEDEDVGVAGATTFIDIPAGYIEAGYGFLYGYDSQDGLAAHFLTASYTARYANTLSNSTRVFYNFTEVGGVNVGADNNQNVDGFAIISENSIVSGLPSTLVPYANFFVGFGTPQPIANANGLLINVGINFETDALTGFPALDATASNTFGGALGLQYLFNLDQQLVFEVATVQPFDNSDGVGAEDSQYAAGVRYQIPISRAWLLRADATYQLLDGVKDSSGTRFEVRRKF